MKRILLLIILFTTLAFSKDVPFSRGVNLTGWFQVSSIKQVQFTKFTKQDFINIKSLGCDVIRLPIQLFKMTDESENMTIDPMFYYFMDQVIDWAEELEIYLLLDNHATAGEVFTDPELEDKLIKVWSQVCEHYKDRSDFIIYEIINEPHDISDKTWGEIQGRVITAIRAVDQNHTIMVTPAGWGGFAALDNMPTYDENNLIYSFHFYDPFLFTHQGAGWPTPSLASLSGVPFPYDVDRMPDCPEDLKGTWIESSLRDGYKNDGTVENVKSKIDIAIKFRDKRNVPIYCGEFGVYMQNADNEDRVRWYGVVPGYLSENNIPWTMWDYKGGFGLFEKGSNSLFEYDLNVPLLEAMGLNVPEQKEYEQQPDTEGFDIYTDYCGQYIEEGSWAGDDGLIDLYNEDAVLGEHCILMNDVTQYKNIGFYFRPLKDLTVLLEQGYAMDFWIKSDFEDTKIDIRFIDTKTGADDHPWRMKITVDNTKADWSVGWNHLQIPLSEFQEGGSWDNAWFNPEGKFDWTQIDKLEIVSEHHDFKGKNLWIDHIRIVDPAVVTVDNHIEISQEFALAQNYPNPFNPSTTIHYSLPRDTYVQIAIFNALGQKIRTLVNSKQSSGQQSIEWNGLNDTGNNAPSGLYFCQLKADNVVKTRKMILMQ